MEEMEDKSKDEVKVEDTSSLYENIQNVESDEAKEDNKSEDEEDLSASEEDQDLVDQKELVEYYKMFFPEWKIETTTKFLKHLEAKLGKEEFERLHVKYGSVVERLLRQLDSSTMQSMFALESLKQLSDQVGEAYEHTPESEDEKGFVLKNTTLSPKNIAKTLKGSEVSGSEARLLILGVNRNVKKIYLYNSGFSVILRAPSLLEINLIYNRISESLDEYGKMLGAIFFMYNDFKLKSLIWDFIRSLIIDSNLKKWDQGNRLRDNVSIHDYHHILLMIMSLMFKNGYDFIFYCHNQKCEKQTDVKIDLGLLQLTDFGKIPYDQLKYLATSAKTEIDPNKHLSKYKKAILNDIVIEIDIYKIHRKVPSITTYLTYGEAFNEEMMMSIHDIKDRDSINQYIRFNYARIFEPWITKIEVIDRDSKDVAFTVKNREDIALVLEQIQNSEFEESFATKMKDFIQMSNVTYIGYLAQPCPNCGTMPDNLVNGYTSFDVQTSFFTAAARALVEKS